MKHGPEAGHAGQVRLVLAQTASGVTVELTNPGPFRGPRPGSGGLPTLRRRLVATYGSDGALAIGDDGGRDPGDAGLPSLAPGAAPRMTPSLKVLLADDEAMARQRLTRLLGGIEAVELVQPVREPTRSSRACARRRWTCSSSTSRCRG